MRTKLLLQSCGALLLIASAGTVAQAQMTVDMSKFTCGQLLTGSSNAVEGAIWLSGYYNGLKKNTMLNLNSFEQNAKAVVEECKQSPKKTVMETVEFMLSRK